jgi:hypothetical protein
MAHLLHSTWIYLAPCTHSARLLVPETRAACSNTFLHFSLQSSVFRIRDILIRIRNLGYGSGSGSGYGYCFLGTGFQDARKLVFFQVFLLNLTLPSVFKDNMSLRSHKTLVIIFLLVDGNISTNNCGSGTLLKRNKKFIYCLLQYLIILKCRKAPLVDSTDSAPENPLLLELKDLLLDVVEGPGHLRLLNVVQDHLRRQNQCCVSALVSMRIRIQHVSSMRIWFQHVRSMRIRIQHVSSMRIRVQHVRSMRIRIQHVT